MSETMLGGTFPNYDKLYETPQERLDAYARAIWGEEFDAENNARWWHVTEVSGMKISGEEGAITNGQEYFTLDPEFEGLRRIDIARDGSVFGVTTLYRSTKTGKLTPGERLVFF